MGLRPPTLLVISRILYEPRSYIFNMRFGVSRTSMACFDLPCSVHSARHVHVYGVNCMDSAALPLTEGDPSHSAPDQRGQCIDPPAGAPADAAW